jgi:hypothetical protein
VRGYLLRWVQPFGQHLTIFITGTIAFMSVLRIRRGCLTIRSGSQSTVELCVHACSSHNSLNSPCIWRQFGAASLFRSLQSRQFAQTKSMSTLNSCIIWRCHIEDFLCDDCEIDWSFHLLVVVRQCLLQQWGNNEGMGIAVRTNAFKELLVLLQIGGRYFWLRVAHVVILCEHFAGASDQKKRW